MANAYDPNQPVRMSIALTVGGTATDPTTLSLAVKDPLGVKTSYTYAGAQLIKDSVGNYHYDLTPVTPGDWYYDFTSTGTAAADQGGFFKILPSPVL